MDIQALTQHAKEFLLQDRELAPVLFAELSGKEITLHFFATFPNSLRAQRAAMFELGRSHGKRHKNAEITQLCLIQEVWGQTSACGAPIPPYKPSEDPARKEYLLVHVLNVGPGQQYEYQGRFIEILRAGGSIDLAPESEPYEAKEGLLDYFLAGFRRRDLSEKKLRKLLKAAVSR